jgi:hypothetical protein
MWDKINHMVFDVLFSVENTFIISIGSVLIGLFIIYILKILLPIIYKFIFIKKQPPPVKFYGIHTIELRSKRVLKDFDVEHEKNHNFTENVLSFIKKIENRILNEDKNFLQKGKRRVLLTRLNPRNRKIKIKYIFDRDERKGRDFFDLNVLDIKRDRYNRNIKVKFFVVYSFVLRLNRKDTNEEIFNVHNNSIKVFFNIGTIGNIKNERLYELEDKIRRKLYHIFIEEFNIRR